MKKKLGLALLTLALLATPVVYVACPQSQAADGSTPWSGLYIGSSYRFYGHTEMLYYVPTVTFRPLDGVVTGYKGTIVSLDTNGDGEGDTFVNMDQVIMYCFN